MSEDLPADALLAPLAHVYTMKTVQNVPITRSRIDMHLIFFH